MFIGRDASLAFITGEFDDKGLTDDISSLSVYQVKALNDWVQFYNENYIHKGTFNTIWHKMIFRRKIIQSYLKIISA